MMNTMINMMKAELERLENAMELKDEEYIAETDDDKAVELHKEYREMEKDHIRLTRALDEMTREF